LRLWDTSGSEIAAFVGHKHQVESMAFSSDGKRLLTRASDWSARLWEVETGRLIAILRETDHQTNSAQFSPDGRRIVTALSNSIARIWDVENGKALMTLEGHRGTVETAAFSPDGKRVVTAALDNSARIWDVESGKSIIVLEGHKGALSSAAYSSDGKRILSVSDYEDTARLWDAETGERLATLEGVDTVEFSPDGRRMVSTVFMSSTAQLWDGVTGKLVANLEGRRTGFANVMFSPDGRRLVMASDAETTLWDAETGKPVAVVKPKIERAAFSPDSRRLLTTDSTNVRLWDAETGAATAVVDAETALMSVAFSPSGDRIVLATATAVRLWEGKVGDKLSGFVTRASERKSTKQRPLRPFAKQLFAISGVSGGALSTVISYAALADSQTKERATNGLGSPPCLQEYNDSQWFAHYVKSTGAPAAAGTAAWRPHESWRGCLQLLLAGDFLSPVFVSLMSDDLLQIGQRGDRAAALEQAWEMRYANMTGQDRPSAVRPKEDPRNPKSRTTLSVSMVFVRDRVLEADPKNWLPIMLLNGTSVTTGRRIIARGKRCARMTPRSDRPEDHQVFGDTYDA
jgi:WD40 repeat protein